MKEKTFKVTGMHCASCELIIEKKLINLPGIQSVEASAGKNEVLVEYDGNEPQTIELSGLFAKENYRFSDQSEKSGHSERRKRRKP